MSAIEVSSPVVDNIDITIFNNSFSAEGGNECQILLCRTLLSDTKITQYLK